MLNGKENKLKNQSQETSARTNTASNSGVSTSEPSQTQPWWEEDEFPLLNSLEIFWKINSDNIELLKENWKCIWEKCCSSDQNEKTKSSSNSTDFLVYEVRKVIEGDVLTVKNGWLDSIIEIWRQINPSFINGEPKELPLFDSAERMYKYLNNMIKIDKIHSWRDFEVQLTRIIEYRVSVAFYWVKL